MFVYNNLEELQEWFGVDQQEFLKFWYSLSGTEQAEYRKTDLKEMERW